MIWLQCLGSRTCARVASFQVSHRLPGVITAAWDHRRLLYSPALQQLVITPAAQATASRTATAGLSAWRCQASAVMAPKRKDKAAVTVPATAQPTSTASTPAASSKRARGSSGAVAKAAAAAADAAQDAVEHAVAAAEAAAAGSPEATPKAKRAKGAALQAMAEAAVAAIAANPALREKAQRIAAQLNELYPLPPIPLDHRNAFQLLVAVILSAQSTDKKVNEISPDLFKVAPDAASLAQMEPDEVKPVIKAIGLANNKAKHLVGMAKMLVEKHDGQVPQTFEELEALPGVGHKTASVIMCQAFGKPAFPVDTHIHRLAQRWGLTNGKSVEQTEADLKALFPEQEWYKAHLQIIYFGREHCSAQSHQQADCPICSWAADNNGPLPLKVGQKRAQAAKGGDNAAASPKPSAGADPVAAKRNSRAEIKLKAAADTVTPASPSLSPQLEQFAFTNAKRATSTAQRKARQR